ncbi:MAG TPA: hypothetical protein VFY84_19285 [Jiangellales bacterium]|nr:hypothetical protein [Jiangellales bacterium]
MNLAKALLLLALPVLVGLSALPGALIKRSRSRVAVQNVADFRDTLPAPADALDDPEQAELDAKWSAYWANSRAQDNALRADLNAYVGEMAGLEERFSIECDQVVKRFTISALARQREIASGWGGWRSNVEREADLIVERVGHSLPVLAHELAVEKAECTDTGSWNEAVQAELIEILNSEDAQQIAASVSARRHRA